MNLPFVVGGAASKDVSVANGGFESGRCPEVEGFGGLNVVVTVKEDRWLAGGFSDSA